MRAESSRRSIGRGPCFLAAIFVVSVVSFFVASATLAEAQTSAPRNVNAASITPFASRKAESLLRDLLPCLGCHTLNGEGGKIGPDLTTVRERRTAAYIAAMVNDPQATAPGSVMPKIELLPATKELIVRYLTSLPGGATSDAATPRAPITPSASDGAALYARWCAACHGSRGKGDGPNASSLPVKPAAHSDADAMSKRPDDSLYDTIAGGGAIMNRSPRMPPFGGTLTSAEIRALVAHIRALCGCQGPQWSRDGSASSRTR